MLISSLSHPYTASTVATVFFDAIVRLHAFPASLVSDRDPVFIANVATDEHCLRAANRWPVKGAEQDHCHVLMVHHRRSSSGVAQLASLGGVLLQHLPLRATYDTIPIGLRLASAVFASLYYRFSAHRHRRWPSPRPGCLPH